MSPIQRLRDKWQGYVAGRIPWAKFKARDLELALAAEEHWRQRFWAKHNQWLEVTKGPDQDFVELGQLREEVELLRTQLRLMQESSPGRELLNAITRTRWFKRQMERVKEEGR